MKIYKVTYTIPGSLFKQQVKLNMIVVESRSGAVGIVEAGSRSYVVEKKASFFTRDLTKSVATSLLQRVGITGELANEILSHGTTEELVA